MTESQWKKLRRGDLVRKDGETGLFQVLAIRPPALLLTDFRMVADPSGWTQLDEQQRPIGEGGNILSTIPMACRMCDGPGYTPDAETCVRCDGSGVEPHIPDETIVTMRIFYKGDRTFPFMHMETSGPLNGAHLIELLEKSLKAVRDSIPRPALTDKALN